MSKQQTMAEVRKNPHLAKFYAKKSCRYCHGRGVLEREIKSEFGWKKHKDLCYCVKKGIEKHS